MFHGRGIWISIGLLPYRHPIVSVGECNIDAMVSKSPAESSIRAIDQWVDR